MRVVTKVSTGKLVRANLVQKLREKGFSRPRAVEMVNLVFAVMAEALIRGEEVEFPFGRLHRVKHKHRPRRGWFLDRITTTYKNPWTVELAIDEEGRNLLDEEDCRREEARLRPFGWVGRG